MVAVSDRIEKRIHKSELVVVTYLRIGETLKSCLVSREVAALYLDVHPATIDRERKAGRLGDVMVGSLPKLEIEELDDYKRRNRRSPLR